ncbi:MAG: GDP-mannose 4,6-dehydratase [Magnetococcales bacterium]|nr:GDP-mannose 4,6-dehydratase [Magnetococcales bacterium]
MKLLITGGCGFLGSNLAAEGLLRGDELCIFDNLSRLGSERNLTWLQSQGSFKMVRGDIRDAAAIGGVVREFQPDAIFHLSGQVTMTKSIEHPLEDFQINAAGTLHLLEAIRQYAPLATLIYSSTNKVYGDLEWIDYVEQEKRYVAPAFPRGFNEKIPLDFHSPYGCSKGAADQYILDYSRIFGLRAMVFRHSSMYGSRQFASFDQGWIGWFCGQAVNTVLGRLEKPFTISGTGKQVRDVLHSRDMTRLYFSAVAKADVARGRVFNIGGGMENSLSLLELFDLLEKLLNVKLDFVRLPPRESDQRIFVADTSLAWELLGWSPQVTAREGIAKMIEWIRESM